MNRPRLSRGVQARSIAMKGRSEWEERDELRSLLEQPINAETKMRGEEASEVLRVHGKTERYA